MIDAATFIEKTLVNPETGALFVLTGAERQFLRHAFELGPDGRLVHPELVFSAPKKSGKTGFGAMCLIYVVTVLGGRYAQGIVVANDFEQAQSRVFEAASRIVSASPVLADDVVVRKNEITFRSTGASIIAIASDFASAAGANPAIVVFDELWGFVYEKAHRLWDELVPSPARAISCRLTVTYAGFSGESVLLENLYARGLKGAEVEPDLRKHPGMLMFWTHSFTAPWQTEAWREQMRETHRPNAYLRQIENRFVSSESTFLDMAWWDRCVDQAAAPVFSDRRLPVWVGVDASFKRDSTAIVACSWDRVAEKVFLVHHQIFQPSPDSPLDFEDTIERALLDLHRKFNVKEVRFDPWQMQATAQKLTRQSLPMLEFPQTVPNLTAASQNLYELVKGDAIRVYPDATMRLAVQRCVAIENPRGWKISKEKQSHKIDIVVALAQAALGAVENGIGKAHVDPAMIQAALANPRLNHIDPRRQVDAPRSAPMFRPPMHRLGFSASDAARRFSGYGINPRPHRWGTTR